MAFVRAYHWDYKGAHDFVGIRDWVRDQLVAAGWTVYADESAYRVFRSDGESGDSIPKYVKITHSTVDSLRFDIYGQWNTSTNTGISGSYRYSAVPFPNPASGNIRVSFHGNKEGFYIIPEYLDSSFTPGTETIGSTRISTYKGKASFQTKTTAAMSAGTGVTVAVASVAGLKTGVNVRLIGQNFEGGYKSKIVGLTSSTVTLSDVPVDFASGAFIALVPALLTLCYGGSYNYGVFGVDVTGAAPGYTISVQEKTTYTIAGLDPATVTGLYTLQTPLYVSGVQEGVMEEVFSVDEGNLFRVMAPIQTSDSIYCISGEAEKTVYSPSSVSSNTVTVSGAGWTVNEFAGKTMAVFSGDGLQVSRVIVSNTSDTLTLLHDFVNSPSTSSGFYIVDQVYRVTGEAYVGLGRALLDVY